MWPLVPTSAITQLDLLCGLFRLRHETRSFEWWCPNGAGAKGRHTVVTAETRLPVLRACTRVTTSSHRAAPRTPEPRTVHPAHMCFPVLTHLLLPLPAPGFLPAASIRGKKCGTGALPQPGCPIKLFVLFSVIIQPLSLKPQLLQTVLQLPLPAGSVACGACSMPLFPGAPGRKGDPHPSPHEGHHDKR